MGAGEGVDAVELDKAQTVDQCAKIIATGWPHGIFSQGMAVKKQSPRSAVVKLGYGHPLASFQGVAKGDLWGQCDFGILVFWRLGQTIGNDLGCRAANL